MSLPMIPYISVRHLFSHMEMLILIRYGVMSAVVPVELLINIRCLLPDLIQASGHINLKTFLPDYVPANTG